MKLSSKPGALISLGALALATAASIAMVAVPAFAATPQSNGSDDGVYIYDSGSLALLPTGSATSYPWDTDFVGATAATNPITSTFACPTGTTTFNTFLASAGNERTIANWTSKGTTLSYSGPVSLPALSLYTIGSNSATVKANGGTVSVGIACTIGGTQLASSGVWYVTAHVTAGTGAYTIDTPTGPAAPPLGAQTYQLHATTIAATDGVLSLVQPTTSDVTFGAATLVNNLSTSTATLPTLTVHDARAVTHPGWTLTSTVATFTNAADVTKTIPNSQLGIAPTITNTTAGGVTVGPTQIAGSAVYASKFAEASNSSQVGDTVLGANLTFVAPASSTPGTYNSTLTLTLTSK